MSATGRLFDDPAPNGPEDVGWSDADRGRAPLRFLIPPGTPERQCRSCKAPVFWIVTARDRKMPVDHDGTSHFATCPNAAKHRRPR